jgi:hypothetical protein
MTDDSHTERSVQGVFVIHGVCAETRGSEALWVCPVCAANVRTVPVEHDEDEDPIVRSNSIKRGIPI